MQNAGVTAQLNEVLSLKCPNLKIGTVPLKKNRNSLISKAHPMTVMVSELPGTP